MMFKKRSIFYWFILRGFNFIMTIYELVDKPSYISWMLNRKMPTWKRTNECSSEFRKKNVFCTLCADVDCDTEPKTGWSISVCTIKIRLFTIVPCIINRNILLHADIILKIIGKNQWELLFIIKGTLLTDLDIYCHRESKLQQW